MMEFIAMESQCMNRGVEGCSVYYHYISNVRAPGLILQLFTAGEH